MKNKTRSFVIAGGARTPVGVKCGTLSGFAPEDLAVVAANEVVRRSGVNVQDIDAAIGANVYQFTAPGAQDIYFPRNVALRCGLPVDTPSLLVQRICGSGLQTVVSAIQQIAMPAEMDDAQVALCFGAETMSRAPRILRGARRSGAHFWEFGENGVVVPRRPRDLPERVVGRLACSKVAAAAQRNARRNRRRMDCRRTGCARETA